MGRRSRQRSDAPPPRAAARKAAASPRAAAGGRERAFDRLPPARRVLAKFLIWATAQALAVIVGIVVLGGSLGPFVVLAYTMLGVGGAFMWVTPRLRVLELSDEDRLLQTVAGGLLVMSLAFAVAGAILL